MASYHPGRAPQVIDEATRPVLEPLESRTLLSVSVDNGTLNITGTDAADYIQVRPAKDRALLKVIFNSEISFFNKADVTAIHVDAGAGDDTVMISEIRATIESPATLLGGDGNDAIQGGGGNDLIQAGAGNDSLLGGRGDDIVEGGAGNDTIISSSGKDTLDGGDDDDVIVRDRDDDLIISSAGSDKVKEGAHVNFPIQTFT